MFIGGTVQKYSYQFGTSPTCGRTAQVPVYTVRARMVRQAGMAQMMASNKEYH